MFFVVALAFIVLTSFFSLLVRTGCVGIAWGSFNIVDAMDCRIIEGTVAFFSGDQKYPMH